MPVGLLFIEAEHSAHDAKDVVYGAYFTAVGLLLIHGGSHQRPLNYDLAR
jgi:hypothetical protein